MGVYVINGKPGVGKSTFCQTVVDLMGDAFAAELSTVDKVKQIAYECGWDGEKNLKNRKFLSDLKDLLTEWDDVPVKDIERKIAKRKLDAEMFGVSFDEFAIFINCREPKEIERLKKKFSAKTILVRREEVEKNSVSNHADENVFDYEYDITIDNNGSQRELVELAFNFIDSEGLYFDWNNCPQIDLFGNFCYNN